MTIKTKYNGTCGSCGTRIYAGTTTQYKKSVGIYCLECPVPSARKANRASGGYRPAGYYASKADPRGLYTPDGRCIGRMACGHEDYPCCGC